jgi:hypothetical protein
MDAPHVLSEPTEGSADAQNSPLENEAEGYSGMVEYMVYIPRRENCQIAPVFEWEELGEDELE